MIGNDVVDLRVVGARVRSPRFDERVMAAAERHLLAGDPDPDRLRWVLWAAKEAAYKAARQCDDAVAFSPRRFVVALSGPDRGHVAHAGERFALRIDADRERVHALACGPALVPEACRWRVCDFARRLPPREQRREARRVAIHLLAGVLGRAPQGLAIGCRGRVPVLTEDGRPSPIGLSLSHHGRFVAAACATRGSCAPP